MCLRLIIVKPTSLLRIVFSSWAPTVGLKYIFPLELKKQKKTKYIVLSTQGII